MIICFLITTILIIWLKTEAWVEYTQLFKLNFLSNYKEYNKQKHEDFTLTYIKFLLKNYRHKFMIRLITCPLCLSLWLSIIAGIFTILIMIPVYFIFSLFIYGIICGLLDI